MLVLFGLFVSAVSLSLLIMESLSRLLPHEPRASRRYWNTALPRRTPPSQSGERERLPCARNLSPRRCSRRRRFRQNSSTWQTDPCSARTPTRGRPATAFPGRRTRISPATAIPWVATDPLLCGADRATTESAGRHSHLGHARARTKKECERESWGRKRRLQWNVAPVRTGFAPARRVVAPNLERQSWPTTQRRCHQVHIQGVRPLCGSLGAVLRCLSTASMRQFKRRRATKMQLHKNHDNTHFHLNSLRLALCFAPNDTPRCIPGKQLEAAKGRGTLQPGPTENRA